MGLMEGYLGALQYTAGITKLQQQQQQFQMQVQQREQQQRDQQQERWVLSDVFNSLKPGMDSISGAQNDTQLAQQYQTAANRLMGINPRDALEFQKTSERLQLNSQAKQKQALSLEESRLELTGQIASGITDQESLSNSIGLFAKAGKTIPQRFQQWNPDTKAYLESLINQSMKVKDQLALRRQEQDATTRAMREADQARRDQEKLQLDRQRESRLQSGMEIKQRTAATKSSAELGIRTTADYERELSVLQDLDKEGTFKNAPMGLKKEAAADVHFRAQKLYADSLATGGELTKEEALAEARRQVLGEFKGGKGSSWNPFAQDTATRERGGIPPAQQPSQAAIQAEATKAWGSYDPNQFEYRVSPEGKLQRRRKQ